MKTFRWIIFIPVFAFISVFATTFCLKIILMMYHGIQPISEWWEVFIIILYIAIILVIGVIYFAAIGSTPIICPNVKTGTFICLGVYILLTLSSIGNLGNTYEQGTLELKENLLVSFLLLITGSTSLIIFGIKAKPVVAIPKNDILDFPLNENNPEQKDGDK